ncbi:MAG: LysR family transcriptional regulator [Bdellovibrionota bacterium]
MTLDQLRYFIAAAKFEHINQAAQSIPISPSVISQSIKQLEEELSTSLFVRQNKRIRLSPEGGRLLELAEDLLQRANLIQHELGRAQPTLEGHFRVGASHFLASEVIGPIWSSMQKKFPRLTVELQALPTWGLVDSILAGRLDWGLGFNPTPHPQLETEEVHEGASLLVVRKNHPIFSHPEKTAYRHLAEYPATMPISTNRVLMTRHHPFLKEAQLDRRTTFSFDSDFVAVENLRRSDHWAILVDMTVARFQNELRVVPFPQKTGTRYSVHLIKHKSRKSDPATIEAFARVREFFAAKQGSA